MNKVSVSICGKDYTITGENTPEQIAKIAAHVDQKMRKIADVLNNIPLSSVAVLTAVNIADEHFDLMEKSEELERTNEQLEKDGDHYIQLWEEAKKSFVTYKEDSQNEIKALKQQKEELRNQLNEKDRKIEELLRNQKNVEKEVQRDSKEAVEEIELKYKELENNFFDLQMENIQIKSELEKLKSKLEWKRDEQQGY